jgi:class 3 adenylate cyclase/tetratricopeptide (TPR) repeat protein
LSASISATLSAFLPTAVLESLASGGLPSCPSASSHRGALLFADISGYTRLAEELADASDTGAEELSKVLNQQLGGMVDVVTRSGGDVLKFAGDAFLGLWKSDDPAEAVLRAARCAVRLRESFAYGASTDGLDLSIGIASGEVLLMHLEAGPSHREIMVGGAALVDLAAIEPAIRTGDIVLTNRAWSLLREFALASPVQKGAVRLEALHDVASRREMNSGRAPVPESLLVPYIAPAILPRLLAGHTDWLAELRWITVLFIELPGLSQTVSPQGAQLHISVIHEVAERYEGSITGISSDEKGIGILVTFGLPPSAHEDDTIRALRAALDLEIRLRKHGLLAAIGIATGRAFCGLIGSESRVHYTVLGEVVNRAARLMEVSSSGTLCDAATYQSGSNHFGFETLPPVRVQGSSELVPVYRPFQSTPAIGGRSLPLVGRTDEQRLLDHLLAAVHAEHRGGLVLIEGEPGIGKSRLMQYARERGATLGVDVIMGTTEAIDATTPYHAWRSVFLQLLHRHAAVLKSTSLGEVLRDALGDKEELAPFLPLLNPLLGTDFPETALTANLHPDGRSRNTQRLLLELASAVISPPMVLLLEDAHWFDSASWQLTRQIKEQIDGLLVLVTSRTGAEWATPEQQAMRAEPGVHHLPLRPLTREETQKLIATGTEVAHVPEAVLDLVYDRAEGNPFFTQELVLELAEVGLVAGGGKESNVPLSALRDVAVPESVQALIVSRIDRLPPGPQLLLKVASVLGRNFQVEALRSICPVRYESGVMDEHLEQLLARGFVQVDGSSGKGSYRFQHSITQEATYGLLLRSQRRRLHRAAAEWYESVHAADLAPVYPLLVHHWRRADVATPLTRYLDLAAEQALTSGAYREAIDFFLEAQRLHEEKVEERGGHLSPEMRERRIGEAYYALGRLRESRDHLERAIASLDRPIPRKRGLAAASEVLVQVVHRLGLGDRSAPTADPQRTVEACLAYERLGEIDLFLGEDLSVVYGAVRNLNLAESIGEVAQSARGYAHMHILLGAVPLKRAARMYQRMALEAGETSHHPAALALVYTSIGLSSTGRGEWDKAHEFLTRSADLFGRMGYRRKREECLSVAMAGAFARGDFEYLEKTAVELIASAAQGADAQAERWAWYDRARLAALRGDCDEALGAIAVSRKLLPESVDPSDEIRFYGLEASIHLEQDRLSEAWSAAAQGVDQVRRFKPLAFWAYDGYANLAEVLIALRGSADASIPATPAELEDSVAEVRRGLRRYRRLFPIAQPGAARAEGYFHWSEGHRARALRAWRKSLACAERLSMPYAQALAHRALGLHSGRDRTAAVTHLEAACSLFGQLGAPRQVQRLRVAWAALDDTAPDPQDETGR